MNDIADILVCLEQAPALLKELLADIPPAILKQRRIPGKWSIHEHACHLATVERDGMFARWDKFQSEERPVFLPLSGESYPADYYLKMELDSTVESFLGFRMELIRRARAVTDAAFWNRKADHPEYELYTPFIMLRHIMMHDHLHMYRIEELWLTRDASLPGAPHNRP